MKSLLLCSLVLVMVVPAAAEKRMVIHRKNAATVTFDVSGIDSITFYEITLLPQDSLRAVLLGSWEVVRVDLLFPELDLDTTMLVNEEFFYRFTEDSVLAFSYPTYPDNCYDLSGDPYMVRNDTLFSLSDEEDTPLKITMADDRKSCILSAEIAESSGSGSFTMYLRKYEGPLPPPSWPDNTCPGSLTKKTALPWDDLLNRQKNGLTR
jgi:hypothetical protein